VKVDANQLNCFESPNFPPLAILGISIDINWNLVLQSDPTKAFRIENSIDNHIVILRIHPDLDLTIIDTILNSNNVKAVIFETYGLGSIPYN